MNTKTCRFSALDEVLESSVAGSGIGRGESFNSRYSPRRIDYFNPGFIFWVYWAMAMIASVGIMFGLVHLKLDVVPSYYRTVAVFSVLFSLPSYVLLHVYHPAKDLASNSMRLLVAWVFVFAGMAFVAFITKTSAVYSREIMIQWFFAGYAVQVLLMVWAHRLRDPLEGTYVNHQRAMIIGGHQLTVLIAETLISRGQRVIGAIDLGLDMPEGGGPSRAVAIDPEELRHLVKINNINCIYIALPAGQMGSVEQLYIDLLDVNADVVWVPDISSLMLINHHVRELDGLPAIYLNESPLTAYPLSAMMKAFIDKVAAFLGIVILSPLLLGVALAIKLSSPGPVFFRQPRHGWNGEIFEVLKFRSMKMHRDSEVKQATRDDDRITPVGRFIRKTSIDELPQLFNVLRGEMSLVGPRPHAVQHNTYYSDKIQAYMARHRIKPGITGLAQINGARGETESLDKMEKRVMLDIEYINRWSLWLDIRILLKTPLALLTQEAY